MPPENDKLVEVLNHGAVEALDVALDNKIPDGETLFKFANRMTKRLTWAILRIEELEAQLPAPVANVYEDRMGGQFTDAEIADALTNNW
jgi:hypothetical protein